MTMRYDGLYDLLLNATLAGEVEPLSDLGQASLRTLEGDERQVRLRKALQALLPQLLDDALAGVPDGERAEVELGLANQVVAFLRRRDPAGLQWADPLRLLTSVHRRHPPFEAPVLPLSVPWLFTAGHGDPSLLSELRRELASADRVDLLMSFITWSGVRRLLDIFQGLTALGADGQPRVRIRVLTTTYTGATELRAVQELAKLPGAELRISLDGRRTRLHAKAWILGRDSGFGTALVGSANLSGAALAGGLEWTVRLTEVGQAELFAAAQAHFETLWNDPEFQAFDPASPEHEDRLRRALRLESRVGTTMATRTWFDLQPKPFQQAMLDQLAAERRHGRTRSLLVAATGTGKTVVAAFDYRRICQALGGRPRLLFVAHRREILEQARDTYRQVLHDGDFGEMLADGNSPTGFDHVFATLQSIGSRRLLDRFGVDHWHQVVLDECHHLTATSFDAFARAIEPALLLGLTATPERADGASIAPYFHMRPDGSPAVELRLWDALDQQLLAPFEYYGVTDSTDFSEVRWNQAGELADLGRIVNGDHVRARQVLDAFEKYSAEPGRARVLGFCVSVAHAEFMAARFRDRGYTALAVTGQTPSEERDSVAGRLARRDLTAVFTCDLYNEGVDLPQVDTLLLLRPTQSPVLFQQQLGRGLRLAPEKDACLVLDFVGRYRAEFRFDRLLQTLTGLGRRRLLEELEAGFPSLPPACHLQFERVARERVLENLRQAQGQAWRQRVRELQNFLARNGRQNLNLRAFLQDQGLALEDLYRANGESGWTRLCRVAEANPGPEGPREQWLGRRLGDLLHADDPECLDLWRRVADPACRAEDLGPLDLRRLRMLAYQMFPATTDNFEETVFLESLQAHPPIARELAEVAALLDEASRLDPRPLPGAPGGWPLRLHARYQAREILTAVGWLRPGRRAPFQAGVLRLDDPKVELLFVTLDKRQGYHAGIAYHDYAISPERFHWQTQNSAGPDTGAGRRYLAVDNQGWTFQLFVREDPDAPYRALGQVRPEKITGNRPMSITWRLEVPLPAELHRAYSVLRGA